MWEGKTLLLVVVLVNSCSNISCITNKNCIVRKNIGTALDTVATRHLLAFLLGSDLSKVKFDSLKYIPVKFCGRYN